jgi:hypothetical protein
VKRGKDVAADEGIESPGQLAERFRRELFELVNHGEISPTFAERVMDDLFVPGKAGEPPHLRWSVWRAYVAELTGDHS